MPMSSPELNLQDPSVWGVEAHGASLYIKEAPKPSGTISLDVENNPDGSCAGIGFTQDGRNIYFLSPNVVSESVKDLFANCKLVGHNIKYDVQMLRKWGFHVAPDQIVWDTQIAEYVKDSTRHRYGLKALVRDAFGAVYPEFKELTGTGKKAVAIGSLPLSVVANYNGCDVLFTHKLYTTQLAEMSAAQIRYLEEIELPTMRVLLEMEERGVLIDASYIRSLDVRLRAEAGRVSTSLKHSAGSAVNLNSPKQVKQFLLDKAGLRLATTSAEELRKHTAIPIVKDLLRYREIAKLLSTYTSVLLEASNGQDRFKLNARFNQCVTQTGRLSSSEPNLQNIPTRTEEGDAIRKGFIASKGNVLVDADYSQIEPRLMAHFSGDKALLDIFLNERDLYDSVSEYVGCDRPVAKTLWLALAYNAGAYKIGQTAGIPTYQAQKFLDKMRQRFSQFFYWKDNVIKHAEIEGGVKTLFGRFIPLPYDLAHLAPNYTVQGSAAEIMKIAIQETRVYSPILTCHDELLFEQVNDSQMPLIKETMENVVQLSVPLKVEIGTARTWSEAKP